MLSGDEETTLFLVTSSDTTPDEETDNRNRRLNPSVCCGILFLVSCKSFVSYLLVLFLQYRPLIWRNTHPYVLVDRFEDVTDPNEIEEEKDGDRSIVFYGYVRGTHLKANMKMHLIGVGDFTMTSVSDLHDPLPLPDKESERKVSTRSMVVMAITHSIIYYHRP